MNTQQKEAETFLCALWEGVPEPHKFLTWTLDRKCSYWWDDPAEAAEAIAGRPNEYVGVGLADQSKTSLKLSERAKANEISGIAGFGLDIDYQDGAAHKGKTLPPDEESAHKLLDAMPLRPTLVVHSGHGLQAWWLLKEHLIFSGDADRMRAAMVARDWNATLAAKAKGFGWEVDSVHDLARVLRIPGTINTKGGVSVPARLLKHDGPRFEDLDCFTAVCVQAPAESSKAGPKLADAPRSREFWNKILSGVEEGGRNNAVASLAGLLFQGMKDVEDERLRRIYLELLQKVNLDFDPPLPEMEVTRTTMSILRAEVQKRAAADALVKLEQSESYAEAAPSDERLRIIASLLTDDNLRIAGITKRGSEASEYAFELDNGTSVTLGSLLNQDQVRRALFDHTAGTPDPVVIRLFKKPEWLSVCRHIAAAARSIDAPEYGRATQGAAYLGAYIEIKQGSTGLPAPHTMSREEWVDGAPFFDAGEVYIGVLDLTRTLRTCGNPWNEKDWANALMDIGFERAQVNRRFDGKQIKRRCWKANASMIEAKHHIHAFRSANDVTNPSQIDRPEHASSALLPATT